MKNMSSRKNSTITGCKGLIKKRNEYGSLIDVHEEEYSCPKYMFNGTVGCQEFREKSGFLRVRAGVV